MSASVGQLSRSVSALAGRKVKSKSHDDEGDVARPAHMAKSFVSLLTTASMYTGNLTDLVSEDADDVDDDGDDVDDDDDDGDDDDSSSEPDQEAMPDDTAEELADNLQEGNTTLQGSQATDTGSPTPSPRKALARTQTLFELSIEQRLNRSTGSSTTDLHSRAQTLCEKLRTSFDIREDDVFIAEYSCWLLKDVLLQGHIYLTQSHLLFLAFLPKHDKNKATLSGHLTMDNTPPGLPGTRYWAVLKNHTLSLYTTSTELYFPLLTIDLRYAIRVELKDLHFRILTESRSYKFHADSTHSARSWAGLLKKHIFASRNKGDCVSLKIPLQNVLDIEQTSIFDGAETIRVKALEGVDSFVYDDYFFMFFNSGPAAYKTISEAIGNMSATEDINDLEDSTTRLNTSLNKALAQQPLTSPILDGIPSPSEGLTSPAETFAQEPIIEKYISRDVEEIPDSLTSEEDDISPSSDNKVVQSPGIETPKAASRESRFLPDIKTTTKILRPNFNRWTPHMLKNAMSMWHSNPVHYTEKNSIERGIDDDEYLASPEETVAATKRFQDHFSLSESEILVSSYYAHLHRNIPVYGKIYLGAKEICFRSLVPGLKTKMILPYKDIENCYKEKGFKFGYYGLVIVIHGHEELFLEFGSSNARDDCEFLLLKQLEDYNSSGSSHGSDDHLTSSGKLEEAKIKLFEDKIHRQAGFDVPIIIEEHPLLKTSLKPGKSYRFTLLTIGSRGDVQPFIALGLGLKKEGHTVRISTHAEFKPWVESHGLEFKEIAGDPTELMSLMVSHGSMNVGLLREASSKFRGWISELLQTSWEACQGTEILIESPSTMAGIHIAEALGIPYFRAFTMPWTRTRAYPHAFIVPDEKKGGSYNYLTHVLFENVFWKGISGQVNKWRKEVLKLPKTNLDMLQQNKVPFLYNISPTVFPPSVDFSEWVRVTGYWFLDEATSYDPPQELTDFISQAKEDNKKLVYIGFGSIVVSNPRELTKAVIDAVVDADVRCILNKGWSERLGGSKDVEIDLPDEVYNAGALPHDWLFPQIDAAVHHGGSGTTGATLRAGLPTIIKPFFGDQFFYANRVKDIGAGIALKKLNVKSLSKALKEATTNQRIISKAKSIQERIGQENGVMEAINVIYRELEYSRELIMNKRKLQITKEEEDIIDQDDKGPMMDVGIDDLRIGTEQDVVSSIMSDAKSGRVSRSVSDDEGDDDEASGSWLLV
ncbi:Sterol 3-beta-glucosyltransferase [Cyberlindnera fabianii]|uniref:Sterol 3-beta-glucosyltransferase n=1 Tax=Cyberlindnera fabianii TaxID=36022 RepID=A0A1V2L236_CYBFA|nr:Sterol 3-beta-glucosyltransferase [Cyberlindnera fabianii]